MRRTRVRAVVAIGEAASEVEAAFAGVRPVVVADSMADAVASAAELARPGDAVLSRPGVRQLRLVRLVRRAGRRLRPPRPPPTRRSPPMTRGGHAMTTITRLRTEAESRAAHPTAHAVRARSRRRRTGRPPRPPAGKRSTAFLLLFAVLVVLNLIGLVMVLSASSVTALHDRGSSWYYFERELL